MAVWAQIAGASQILDLLNFTPAIRAGTSDRILVHETDISTAIIKQVIFVIAPPLLDNNINCVYDGII